MAIVSTVELHDGAVVVRRRADAVDAERLRGSEARLRAAAHPGVLRVVAGGAVAGGWELVTAHAGAPVDPVAVATGDRLARLGARVATTLADLHERGLVHGSIERAHVLVDRDGEPVLCGFGPGRVEATPADDVGALGELLASLLDGMPSAAAGHGALRSLLAAATGPADRRPGARRLATELHALGRDAVGVPRPRRGPRLVLVVSVALVPVLLALAGRAEPQPAGTAPSTTLRTPTTTRPPGRPCAAVEGHAVEPAGCGFEASVDGAAVVVDGIRSVVGRAGDEVAVGDWDCDGTPDPAVLRPSSGELLVLGPADSSGARSVVVATRVEGAGRLDLGGEEGGCPTLAVVAGDGVRTAVATAP